jgi:hypothetical protein
MVNLAAMPIDLEISHEDRLVIAHVGDVGPQDFEHYFAALTAAGAMPYRKIIDLSASPLLVRGADVKALTERVNVYAGSGALGAIAVVVTTDMAVYASEAYAARVKAERPFRLVDSLAQARAWLDEVDPVRPG